MVLHLKKEAYSSVSNDIKAIETEYDGHRFRSRLEARWAVFFNAVGLTYEYEIEGFEMDGTRYLPDFYIPNLNRWFEIKGKPLSLGEIKSVKNSVVGLIMRTSSFQSLLDHRTYAPFVLEIFLEFWSMYGNGLQKSIQIIIAFRHLKNSLKKNTILGL